MKNKKILWISLAVVLTALLLVLGSILLRPDRASVTPPVTVAPQPETEPPQSSSESTEDTLDPQQSSSREDAADSEEESSEEESSQAPSASEPSTQEPSTQAPSTEPAEPPTAPPTIPSTEGEEIDWQGQIDELIAEIYALRDYYIARLAYLEDNTLREYEALPESERTAEKRRELALAAIDSAYALERECDSRMDDSCVRLSYLLLQSDGDLNLINQVRYAYASQKEKAKSAFIEKYADYFG